MPKKVRPASAFGERLTALRRARGLTQVQLTERIGSTQRAVSRYEAVADRAPAPVLARLAQALAVSTDQLLGVERTRAAADLTDEPEARRLWRKFQQVMALPEKDRRAVIRLVNSLVTAKAPTRDRAPPPGHRLKRRRSMPTPNHAEEKMIEKIKSLPPDKLSEVEDFVDFLKARDSLDDADYDRL